MFKTAKNTIKKAAKDQVEFVGAILTGVFAGSIFTLAYKKSILCWDYSAIGAMLAGPGTIGLLYIASKTANSWREQLNEAAKRESLDQFYETSLLSHWSLIQHIKELKEFKEENITTLRIRIKENNQRKIETTAKHNVATSKLKVHWNGLVIQGTTPMDLINLYKEFDSLFSQNTTNEANEQALNLCIEFQQKFTDAYFHYGSTLVNKS